MIIAMTGGTGFVGARVIAAAIGRSHRIRALTRRPQTDSDRLTWVEGALDDPAALRRLIGPADTVLHIAGVVNAPDRAGFAAGNIDGTQAMVHAAREAGVQRFIHVSSLAAREPTLSDYGWSKAEAEHVVAASSLDWTMVRPPAIYGPGDMEMRDMFRMARFGLAMLPPPGRLSVIHVDDLATLLVALAVRRTPRDIYEVDDGTGGWSHANFAHMIGSAVGRKVMALSLSPAVMRFGAKADRLLRRGKAKLTPDRVAYFCHPDWTIDPDRRPPRYLWEPAIATPKGLADTAQWYRDNHLL
ncbi:epimerase [Sphingomonas sp. Leaf17]|uniref:NAD-dependent epimerase/dehydratase family protein n=1 Tax=Sphingomonas sp. Leaf17 TaxID=1735683 RepID=UPI0006F3934E|nr:NAD-dependent epimerase/dehydratase family protein [Sphingomonas sp. Leaf17]KQM67694.1 epimerase [Sphingomonas sp. Leaf17]